MDAGHTVQVTDSSTDLDVAEETLSEPAPGGRFRNVDKGLLAACFVIAAGLVLIVWGVSSALTGTEGVDRPAEIENLSPVENAVQVLQQESVFVDLAPGYEGVLVVDGIEIAIDRPDQVDDDLEPGEQQLTDPTRTRYDPGSNTLTFRPAEGAPIESWTVGRHDVVVVYWLIEDGRGVDDQRYRWSFDVV